MGGLACPLEVSRWGVQGWTPEQALAWLESAQEGMQKAHESELQAGMQLLGVQTTLSADGEVSARVRCGSCETGSCQVT